jgi:hypothetical protein
MVREYLVPGNNSKAIRPAFEGAEEIAILIVCSSGYHSTIYEHHIKLFIQVCTKAQRR